MVNDVAVGSDVIQSEIGIPSTNKGFNLSILSRAFALSRRFTSMLV